MNMSGRQHTWSVSITLGLFLSLSLLRAAAQTIQDPPVGRPDAVIDLASHEGVQLVNGQWCYHEVKIVDADSRAVGPDLKPSGAPTKTYDYAPHAEPIAFDDSRWEAIDATALDQRRSTAKVCFNWYRINITIPEKVANFSTAGSTVAFEIVIDDYAEVWVNGKMPRVLGEPGGPVIKGFNAPKRVIITRNAEPGQRIQLAVFGSTGQFPTARRTSSGSSRPHLIFTSRPKLRSARLQRRSSRKIQRWTRSFRPA
jgi:gluconolactonase